MKRSRQPRCADEQTLSRKFDGELPLVEVVLPFSMFATNLLLSTLQATLQDVVATYPRFTNEELVEELYNRTQREKLQEAIKNTKIPCSRGKWSPVFPDFHQELQPDFPIISNSVPRGYSPFVGSLHWEDGLKSSQKK